jgi:hypothetical protein
LTSDQVVFGSQGFVDGFVVVAAYRRISQALQSQLPKPGLLTRNDRRSEECKEKRKFGKAHFGCRDKIVANDWRYWQVHLI